MIEAGEALAGVLEGRDRAALDSDRMLLFALVRAVEIVGEAASRVSKETRAATPATGPWGLIVGMRNRLIHAYFDSDHDILWRTVTDEIPELIKILEDVLPE